MNRKILVAFILLTLLPFGCALNTKVLEDNRVRTEIRAGLKDATIFHGHIETPGDVDIDFGSDIGDYLVVVLRTAVEGTGGFLKDTVETVKGWVR